MSTGDERLWTTTAVETAFRNAVLELRLEAIATPDGRHGQWTVIEIADGVAVLPVHADGAFTLISQYRHPSGAFALELPAGRREPGEEPIDTARRELIEEAGFEAQSFDNLGFITPLNGIARHRVHIFRARGLTPTPMRHETFEDIRVLRLTPEDLDLAIREGRVVCGILLAAMALHARTARP